MDIMKHKTCIYKLFLLRTPEMEPNRQSLTIQTHSVCMGDLHDVREGHPPGLSHQMSHITQKVWCIVSTLRMQLLVRSIGLQDQPVERDFPHCSKLVTVERTNHARDAKIAVWEGVHPGLHQSCITSKAVNVQTLVRMALQLETP